MWLLNWNGAATWRWATESVPCTPKYSILSPNPTPTQKSPSSYFLVFPWRCAGMRLLTNLCVCVMCVFLLLLLCQSKTPGQVFVWIVLCRRWAEEPVRQTGEQFLGEKEVRQLLPKWHTRRRAQWRWGGIDRKGPDGCWPQLMVGSSPDPAQ